MGSTPERADIEMSLPRLPEAPYINTNINTKASGTTGGLGWSWVVLGGLWWSWVVPLLLPKLTVDQQTFAHIHGPGNPPCKR